ncbi:MAG: hypothetical protein HY331_13285 [Chloroflexi bacterium]|nr:hypothetical protein [Chloroflexota bacterium]
MPPGTHRPLGRRVIAALVLLIGALLLGAVTTAAPALVLVPLAGILVQEAPARPADAVVLTPDMSRHGFREAVGLWRRGTVGYLLVSNGAIDGPPGTGVDQWSDLARRELALVAVPDAALVVVERRPCTMEKYAEAVRETAVEHGFRRLILMAPQLETRRLQRVWTAFLAPAGLEAQVVAYEDRRVALDRWWTSRAGVSAVFNGYLGYVIDLIPMGPFPGCA